MNLRSTLKRSCNLKHHFLQTRTTFPDIGNTHLKLGLIFAFALRQCDLMKIFPFLDYHLERNFQSDLKTFIPYITQLNRKFSHTLFTDQLIKSIDDWIADKKGIAVKQNQKKVKTNLAV